MKRFLLFDLDRTLWDFDGNADRTYHAMFDQFGLESLCHVDYYTFHERYKVINDSLWEAYRNGTITKEMVAIRRFTLTFECFGCDTSAPEIVRLAHKMSDYYVVEGTKQTGLMPGARQLLQWLAERHHLYSLAVITNGFREAQLPKMHTAGIDSFFDYFFLSEDMGFMKPDRRFFDVALRQMRANSDQCLVIGDDYKVDILGAVSAGIPQVWYNPSGQEVPPGSPAPTYEIRHLSDLAALLSTPDTTPSSMSSTPGTPTSSWAQHSPGVPGST